MDIFRLYVDYGEGWEYEYECFTWEGALRIQEEYAQNCPQYPTMIIKGRKRIEEEKESV